MVRVLTLWEESSAKLLEVGHNVQVTNYLTRPVNNKYIQVYIYA